MGWEIIVLTNRKVSDVLCRRLAQTPYKLDQTAFSEVAEIATGRTLHQIDGELQEANFPCVVYALDDRAEWFVFVFDLSSGAIDHCVNRFAEGLFV